MTDTPPEFAEDVRKCAEGSGCVAVITAPISQGCLLAESSPSTKYF